MKLKAEFEALPIEPATLSLPTITRSNPETKSGYEGYRPVLRNDFLYSCAYCSMAEYEALGHTWEIDHFKPISKHVDGENPNEYSNLNYSCHRCNGYKSDIWPTPADQLKGKRFLRPDKDAFTDHIEVKGDELRARTRPGMYTVIKILLNREQAKNVRRIRRELGMSNELIQSGLQALRGRRIDRFPVALKARLEQAAKQLQQQSKNLDIAIDNILIAEMNKDASVDTDSTHQKQLALRRKLDAI
jgi:5-methylcytosine-specific restriction endonuclease McrA